MAELRIPNIAGTKPYNYNMSAIQKSIFEIVNKQKNREVNKFKRQI